MESKTPEELAVIATNKSKYYQYPAGSYSAHTVETAFFDGFEAGYAAALPKWVSASENPPKEYDKYLGRFEVKADFWAIPLVVFYWRTVIDTADYFDQNGNALGHEYIRLIEYTELPPTKEP